MEPTPQALYQSTTRLAEEHGVCMPGTALSIPQLNQLQAKINKLPWPDEVCVTSPIKLFDFVTKTNITGVQYEAGVRGWGVYVDEVDGRTALIAPPDWYSAQFRVIGENYILPYFLQFNGGDSAIHYHWQTEETFMDPPIQYMLPAVDVLQKSGTWVKARFQPGDDGVYRPSLVAVDLEYDSNGLTAQMARDQVSRRHRIVFDPSAGTYTSANRETTTERATTLVPGYTVINRGRTNDTHRNPAQIHLNAEFIQDGIEIRITPYTSLWQTEFTIPNGITIPDYPGETEDISIEGLDYWVDQHRGIL